MTNYKPLCSDPECLEWAEWSLGIAEWMYTLCEVHLVEVLGMPLMENPPMNYIRLKEL